MKQVQFSWSKRLTAIVLAVVLLASMLPLSAFVGAAEGVAVDLTASAWTPTNATVDNAADGSLHITASKSGSVLSAKLTLPEGTAGYEYVWGIRYAAQASSSIIRMDMIAYDETDTALSTLQGRSVMASHNTAGYSAWEKLVTYATVPAGTVTVALKVVFDGVTDLKINEAIFEPISDNLSVARTVDSADTLSLTAPHFIKTMLSDYTYRMQGTASDLPLTLTFYNLSDEAVETLEITSLPVEFVCPGSTYAMLSGSGTVTDYTLTQIANPTLTDTDWQAHSIWYPEREVAVGAPGHFYFFRTPIKLDSAKLAAGKYQVRSFRVQVLAKDAVRSIGAGEVSITISANKNCGKDNAGYHYWEKTIESGKRSGWAFDATAGLNRYLNVGQNTRTYEAFVLSIMASNATSTGGLIFQGEIVYKDGTVQKIQSGITHETMVFDGGVGSTIGSVAYAAQYPSKQTVSINGVDTEISWTHPLYECDASWVKVTDQGAVPNAHIPDECAFYDEYSARYTITPTERPTVTATGGKQTTVTVNYSDHYSTDLRKTALTGHLYKDDILVVTVPVTASYDDEAMSASFSFTVPDYVGTGSYDFRLGGEKIALLNADGKEDNMALLDISNNATRRTAGVVKEGSVLCTLTLTQPSVSAAVTKVGNDAYGNVYLTVNGKRTSPVIYLQPSGNRYTYDMSSQMQASGVELYACFEGGMTETLDSEGNVVVADSIWLPASADVSGVNHKELADNAGFVNTDLVDEQIYKVLNTNPNAYLLYNLTADAPEWWKADQAHADDVYDISAYDSTSGVTNTVSFASTQFRTDCGKAIYAIAEHIAAAPYANRVIGIRLSGGRTAEWMHEAVTEQSGLTHQVDFSTVMINAFNAEYSLSVTETDIRAAIGDDSSYGMLLDLDDETTRVTALKYNEFLSKTVSDTILHFAEQVKTASAGNLMTGAYNGYSWSTNSASVGSTHSTVDMLLESAYIDYISAPADYSERITGYKTGYMALSDSVKAHGKLFMVEQDNRTVYMTEISDDGSTDSVGHTDTAYDGVKQLWRDFTTNLVNGVGFWGYDMLGGWYNDPAFEELFAKIKAAYDDSLDDDTRSNSEVAVWVDNNNFDYMVNPPFSSVAIAANQSYALFKQMHVDLRKELAQLGTSYDVFAIEDVAEDTLSADTLAQYKVHLVISPFQLSTAERNAMEEKVKVNGNTVLWIYLPGLSQDNGAWNVAALESLTDFDINNTLTNTTKVSTTNGVALKNGTAVPTVTYGGSGSAANAAPTATILDGTALATYTGGGTSVAYKDAGTYTSIYSAAPHVPVELLRAVCADAGVHLYAEDMDLIVETNASYIAVNSLTSGEKTITLPAAMTMRDVLTGEVYTGTTYTLDMDAADTVLLAKVQPEDTWDAGLIPNGSFEDNGTTVDPTVPNKWAVGTNGNVERTYEKAYGDSWYSLKATAPFSAQSALIKVKPNTVYTLTFSHIGGAADYGHTVRAQCYDAGGNALFASYSAYVWSGGMVANWETVTVSFKTTENTSTVSILFNAQGNGAAGSVSYWDNFSLVEHEHEYTDGDYLCDTVFSTYRPLEENTTAQSAVKPDFVCGYDNEMPEFAGANMTLGEEFKLNMYVDPHEVAPEDITVTLDSLPEYSIQQETAFALSGEPDENGYYSISIRIPAAHMHKTFTATLAVNGETVTTGCDVPSKTYSAEEYAMSVVNGSYTAKQKAAAKAMLNYGAWAQKYFGVDEDDLANAGLADADRLDAGETEEFKNKIVGIPKVNTGTNDSMDDETVIIMPDGTIYNPPKVYPIDAYKATTSNKLSSFVGYSLLMRDNVGLRMYFADNNAAFTLNGEAVELVKDTQSDRYYLELILPADELTADYTVTATENGATMTVTGLSVLTPARTVINNSKTSENYKNVCVALILYAEAVYGLAN